MNGAALLRDQQRVVSSWGVSSGQSGGQRHQSVHYGMFQVRVSNLCSGTSAGGSYAQEVTECNWGVEVKQDAYVWQEAVRESSNVMLNHCSERAALSKFCPNTVLVKKRHSNVVRPLGVCRNLSEVVRGVVYLNRTGGSAMPSTLSAAMSLSSC